MVYRNFRRRRLCHFAARHRGKGAVIREAWALDPTAAWLAFADADGSVNASDLLDLIGLLRDRLAVHDPIIAKVGVEHVADRPGDVRHSLANIDRARAVLGYAPGYDLASGLDRAVPWYRENWKQES